MIRELKKLWHPIHFVVLLLVVVGTMWNLHNSMYNGAYFLRDEMIAAWEDVLAQDDPLGYVQKNYNEVDSALTELQMQYMFAGSEEERQGTKEAIQSLETREGSYSNSLPFDLMVLYRIQSRMEHISTLEAQWEKEQDMLARAVKRKGYEEDEARRILENSERYAHLTVPEYANIDPFEDFAEWNTSYAYIVLLPVVWIVAQAMLVEKKTGMRELICAAAKSPKGVAVRKVGSAWLSAFMIVTGQFLAGLGIAAYMAGGFGGLASEVQAMYSMGLCYFPLSIGALLCCQLAMQNALAFFAVGCTMFITAHLQEEWQALPVVVAILIAPNVLHLLFPEAQGLDIASIAGVMQPMGANSLAPVLYAIAGIALAAFLCAYACHRFVRKAK